MRGGEFLGGERGSQTPRLESRDEEDHYCTQTSCSMGSCRGLLLWK